MNIISEINIFDYLDYRAYLKAWYESAKDLSYGFSLRVFSQKAGFGSSNILKLVMDGDRNLTLKSLRKFIKGLELGSKGAKYFRHLVLFNQAKTHDEKNEHFSELIAMRNYRQIKSLEVDQYDYCAEWYHSVVRELVVSPGFNGSTEWIAHRIDPPISEAQARDSIALLQRLAFIKKSAGKTGWELTTPLVTTGPETQAFIMKNFHQNVLDLVKTKVSDVDQDKRDISALTLGIVRERLPQLKKMLQEFRGEVLKLVADDHRPEEVMMLTMQLIPVTTLQEQGEIKL